MRMTKLPFALVLALLMIVTTSGCTSNRSATTQRAADARADASAEPKKTGDPADDEDDDDAAKKARGPRKTLYERIGGEKAIAAVVDDLVSRAAADPAVNFTRKGTPHEWPATPENVARLKQRLVQFFGTATGGPQRYEGEDMRTAHRGMRITPAEFNAFAKHVGASLDRAGVKAKERKEILAIVESARGTVVEVPGTR